MTTIVFILASAQDPRSFKRIREFIGKGYEVEVYAFDRGLSTKNKPTDFEIRIIGAYTEELSYLKRIPIIRKGLAEVKRNIRGRKVLLYAMGLDIAFLSYLVIHKPFVFEEADLVHTYIGNATIRKAMERIDRFIVRKSRLSVFTSDGFVQYHYGSNPPSNIVVVPNKLSPKVLDVPLMEKHKFDPGNIQIGFVGGFRFDSIYNFTLVFLKHFPQHEFHVFGLLDDKEQKETLESYPNFHFHGVFKNPDDLPGIYSQLDLALCTYDTRFENVRYAEPNKIYESIYFETPIIVSSGTFLSQRVEELGIGFSIDPFSEEEICRFVEGVSEAEIAKRQESAARIGKQYAIDNNEELFEKLTKIITD